jgi:hypothetical protein
MVSAEKAESDVEPGVIADGSLEAKGWPISWLLLGAAAAVLSDSAAGAAEPFVNE